MNVKHNGARVLIHCRVDMPHATHNFGAIAFVHVTTNVNKRVYGVGTIDAAAASIAAFALHQRR